MKHFYLLFCLLLTTSAGLAQRCDTLCLKSGQQLSVVMIRETRKTFVYYYCDDWAEERKFELPKWYIDSVVTGQVRRQIIAPEPAVPPAGVLSSSTKKSIRKDTVPKNKPDYRFVPPAPPQYGIRAPSLWMSYGLSWNRYPGIQIKSILLSKYHFLLSAKAIQSYGGTVQTTTTPWLITQTSFHASLGVYLPVYNDKWWVIPEFGISRHKSNLLGELIWEEYAFKANTLSLSLWYNVKPGWMVYFGCDRTLNSPFVNITDWSIGISFDLRQ